MKIFRDYSSKNNRDYQKREELILSNLVRNSDGQIKTDYHGNVFVEVKKLF